MCNYLFRCRKRTFRTSAHFRTGHESDGQVQSNGSTKETQLEQADGK